MPSDPTKKSNQTRRGGGEVRAARYSEEVYATARILYESTPGMTFVKLAEETGISWRTLENRSRKDGWKKNHLLLPTSLGEAAQAVADKYAGKVAEYGPELGVDAAKQAAMVETATEVAVDVRAQLIERHRREWGAIRSLVYETLRTKTYGDHAKLAKISSETLQIIQANERKAWGIDKPGDDQAKLTVVIERGL